MLSIASLQNVGSLVLICSFSVPLYVIIIVAYRVVFHPLAKYPGPLAAKVTDFYSVYHAWKGDRHLDFERCHRKYGPVFRYGPNRLSFNTQTALQTINSAKANTRKGGFYHGLITPAGPSILSAISNDVHARKRRVLSQAFSDKAIRSTQDYTLTHIRRFCEKLATTSEPLDMAKWCTFLTGDVLGEVCFGNSFEMLSSPKNRGLMNRIAETGRFALICGSTINLQDTPFPKLFLRSLLAGRMEFRAWAMSQAALRMKTPSSAGRKDFYHYLMETKPTADGEKFTPQELWSEAGNLIVAGTDTTSTVLASTFFYLTRNPTILERVRNEVREVFEGCEIEDIRTGEKLKECKYLRACLDESMRMSPPVPGILPRVVLPGGLVIDGHTIPEGTEVGVAAYALHHNPVYHKEHWKYDPERFLARNEVTGKGNNVDGKEDVDVKGKVEGFAPFSYGPRNCIGKNMAWMELMVTMARVLWLFDFKGVGELGERVDGDGGEREEYRIEDFFITQKFGPVVKFTARKDDA